MRQLIPIDWDSVPEAQKKQIKGLANIFKDSLNGNEFTVDDVAHRIMHWVLYTTGILLEAYPQPILDKETIRYQLNNFGLALLYIQNGWSFDEMPDEFRVEELDIEPTEPKSIYD